MSKLLEKKYNINQNDTHKQTQINKKNINPINTFDFYIDCPACGETCSSFFHNNDYILEYNCKNNHKNICTLLQLYENKKTKTNVNNIKYDAYCLNCNEDICTHCENKHKDHKKEFYFENSKILKKQLNELNKKKKEFDALIKELKKEIEEKLNDIQKSFEIYLDIKNNFESLTKEKLDNQINFNMNFNKDLENIINISKEKNIIKTFEAIFRLLDKISYKDSIYKKSNNFLEIKVENIYINKCIKNKEYIFHQQEQFEIKADKRNIIKESNETKNQIINIEKGKYINIYKKFVRQSNLTIFNSQLERKLFKNTNIIYTMLYYNNPYNHVLKKNNLYKSSKDIAIHNSKKLRDEHNMIPNQISENKENIEPKSENSEINGFFYDTPEETEYIIFSFYRDKCTLDYDDECDRDDICNDNCNELALKKRAEKEEKLDTYNYNQDIIIIYLKEENYPFDKCRTYTLYIIYCNKYLIFKLKNINVDIFLNFKVISSLLFIIKFILWFYAWNNYYDLISRKNNHIEDVMPLVSLSSSNNRNLIEYYRLFNSLIPSLSNNEQLYVKTEKRNETKKLFQLISFDKRTDLSNSYKYFENRISSSITYQTNIKLSINEFYIILYNNILNNLNNLFIQQTIIKTYLAYLDKKIQENINSCPKQIKREQNLSYNHTSNDLIIENSNNCSINENNEIELFSEVENCLEEKGRGNKFYNDYDEFGSSLVNSIKSSDELKIKEKNENENRDLNFKGDITTINKVSNSPSFSSSIIMNMEDFYNYSNILPIIKIEFVEITNNIEEIKKIKNNFVKQKSNSSYNKIFFVLLSNKYNLYPISKNINLIGDSLNHIKQNENKEDISLSTKNRNTNETNKNISINSNVINANNILIKRKNKSPEFINTIIRLYITNHNSRFFNFDYSGIKFHLRLITAHYRDKIVYILFLFDNVLLFYIKKDKNMRRLIFPQGYISKNILNGYKYRIGKKFLPR